MKLPHAAAILGLAAVIWYFPLAPNASSAASASNIPDIPGISDIVELEADRKPRIVTNGTCFIKNGTLLTVTNGMVDKGSILVKDGRIVAIGKDVVAPPGVPVIDATGKFVTPGIIDAHSHIASDEVNEGTDAIVAEVRIHDILDPQSLSIYQKLASGFTSSLILHGSSNPIGGQSAVVKLKWKNPVADMVVPDAPRMIKFALGENVKSPPGDFGGGPRRYPGTRMGTEAVYRRAFTEAKGYMAAWDRYQRAVVLSDDASRKIAMDPPRRDLRLEALADILRGKIWVQCHSYRADEMLMMLRISKEFGFKLSTLQHALEAYKIAPEIAAAGVGVSTFADQWGYKVEAYDAIPHNAALCSRAGIVASVNTDTGSGVTLLNLDAAKAMRYGGLTEDEALRLVTINPAVQLGISRRTGSLEVGKDADIAIWDGHPLSVYSRCAMTLVEGTVLFQRRDAFGLSPSAVTARAAPKSAHEPAIDLPKPSAIYAIIGARVHPVVGPELVGGTVLVEAGKITAVGGGIRLPKGTVVVNAKGLHIYPGLIDAGSNLGLKEIEQVGATVDTSEVGRFQPDHYAASAINPASEHIAVARCEGITTALARPSVGGFGGGPLVVGQSAVIDLAGWTPDEMAVRPRAALHVRWPEGLAALPTSALQFLNSEERDKREKSQKEEVRNLKAMFDRARRYAASQASDPERTAQDAKLRAMAPFATGKEPIVLHVRSVRGTKEALKFAEGLGLRVILVDGGSAWRLAETLAEKRIPVICQGQTISLEGDSGPEYDPYDAPFAGPALLQRAGVKVCFQSSDAAQSKNLKTAAGVAAAFGLPRDEALKAVTINAAEVLGVADKLGSIQVGKQANLIVTDGDPFEMTTRLRYLFIKGKPVPLESRHTRLYEQYRNRK